MDNNIKISDKERLDNENKGRGLFYGVIAVATFIIMAVGATFAYFTATTSSTDSAVTTGSTSLQLTYISYGEGWSKKDLIPANPNVVEYSFEKQDDTTMTLLDDDIQKNSLCKDDYGNSICSIYVFQVVNTANSPQSVAIDLRSDLNEFQNLSSMIYEISVGDEDEYNDEEENNGYNDPKFRTNTSAVETATIDVIDGNNNILDLASTAEDVNKINSKKYYPIYVNRKGVNKKLLQYVKSGSEEEGNLVTEFSTERDLSLGDTTRLADRVMINGLSTKTFALVLYIKNLEKEDQTKADALKKFSGTILIGSGDGTVGVSGSIGLVTDDTELQSKPKPVTPTPSDEEENNPEGEVTP